MTTPEPSGHTSPRWGPTVKTITGLTIVGVVFMILYQYRVIIGPLILSFILAYMLHPIGAWVSKILKIGWRTAINLIFLILIILLLASFTLLGVALVQQIQSLIALIQSFISNLPTLIADITTKTYRIGPLVFTLAQYDLASLANQLLSNVQPLIGQVGNLVGTFATSAATTLAWLFFVLFIAYFLLAEANQVSQAMVHIDIPGYENDIRLLNRELANTWNAFLRGQLLIIAMVIIAYSIMLTIMGVPYPFGIAVMAGLARFIPWLGPFATWTVTALATLLQGGNYFGLEGWKYAVVVVVLCLLFDQVFDYIIQPRFMGQTLGIHPAAVIVAAIILTSLIGLVGLLLAAPVLATLNLIGRYILRKMFDLDPWPIKPLEQKPREPSWARLINWLKEHIHLQRRAGP